MPKRRHRSFNPRSRGIELGKPSRVEYLREKGTLQGIKQAKEHTAKHLEYQWGYYAELAHQRNQIQDELKKILIQSSLENY